MSDDVHYQQIAGLPGLVLSTARFAEFSFERHFHLDYHIGLVTEGVQRQQYKGNTFLLGPGRIVLMPPGEVHDGRREGRTGYTLKTFRLSWELLRDVAAETSGLRMNPALAGILLETPQLAAKLLRLHAAMQKNQGALSLAVQTEWLSLLHLLFVQVGAIRPQVIKEVLSPLQLGRVKEFCFAHLDEKIRLDSLAALCSLGPFQFLRQFKQTVGMTPHAWLVRLRLEQACSLLSRSPQTIAEVAHAVGFYDQSHFNRAFRQAFGVTPSSYQ